MIESYDINDYLKDDKELQKAVIQELLKELSTQQGTIDAYQMSENEANEIIAELKAENDRLKSKIKDLQIRKDRYYLKGLEQERQISDYITLLQGIKAIVCGNYEIIDSQGRKDILKLITKVEEE